MRRVGSFVLALIIFIAILKLGTVFGSYEGLIWERHPGNPFDLGVLDASSPWVIYDGQTFKMWYTGLLPSETSTQICYATSPDGVVWTPHGVVMEKGDPGSWDETSVAAPVVLFDGTEYKMWYNGVGNPTTVWGMIGYATSCDGIIWKEHPANPVLTPGDNGGWDDWNIAYYSILYNGSHFFMWYSGQQVQDGSAKIGVATSTDGIGWTKYAGNPVLSPGSYSWEERHVFAGPVINYGSQYEMWYSGQDYSTPGNRIGHALSADGFSWSECDDNPAFGAGPSGSWDDRSVTSSSILEKDGKLLMYYTGASYSSGYSLVGLAFAARPISWEYTFEDCCRKTTLKISTDDCYFQFIASDRDFGIKHDTDMLVDHGLIAIFYKDGEMLLTASALTGRFNFCAAVAFDRQTRRTYLLLDRSM